MSDTPAYKTGKLPATHDPRDLLFGSYLVGPSILPSLPSHFGEYKRVPEWGMLGNDRYGDCVFAGGDHETMMWNAERNVHVNFTDENALSDYGAVTGFDPETGDNDNGTNVRDALGYRRKTGLVDDTGKRHKIGAYVSLEPGNWTHLKEAIFLLGVVGIGFECPSNIFSQFDAHRPWSIVPGTTIDGGHYVPLVGYTDRHLVCVTWGRTQLMSKSFFQKYCDEAWALLSPEMITTTGHSVGGYSLDELRADLSVLTSSQEG